MIFYLGVRNVSRIPYDFALEVRGILSSLIWLSQVLLLIPLGGRCATLVVQEGKEILSFSLGY